MAESLQQIRNLLLSGLVIPASPLALNASRKLDERRQRALWRYYSAAGAGGIAIGVHTTQFAIRDAGVDLYRPLLQLGAEEISRLDAGRLSPLVRIAGVCGLTHQACVEADIARQLGYDAALVSLAAFKTEREAALIDHCRAVASTIPIFGFYLQPAVGGRPLSYRFWRQFLEIEYVAAIKIAPFHRYQTLDVVRAAAESGRDDVALYTGNDDSIVPDLVTGYRFQTPHGAVERKMVGGLLGHWSVWTQKAVELLAACHTNGDNDRAGQTLAELLRLGGEVTDANAALFDAANGFAGCIAGLHEILRRQGLLEGIWCLDPAETLSPGQLEEIDRICAAYPHLNDATFVAQHRDDWLSG